MPGLFLISLAGLRLFVQLRTPVQTNPMIRTTSTPSSKYFQVLLIPCAPGALMPPLSHKNVHKAYVDHDEARHQEYGGQDNMLNHGNAFRC